MIVVAWRKNANKINRANGHSKSLKYRTAIAIPQMAVIDIVHVPKATGDAIVAVDSRHKVAAIKHPRPGAKYSANNGEAMLIARKKSNKG